MIKYQASNTHKTLILMPLTDIETQIHMSKQTMYNANVCLEDSANSVFFFKKRKIPFLTFSGASKGTLLVCKGAGWDYVWICEFDAVPVPVLRSSGQNFQSTLLFYKDKCNPYEMTNLLHSFPKPSHSIVFHLQSGLLLRVFKIKYILRKSVAIYFRR